MRKLLCMVAILLCLQVIGQNKKGFKIDFNVKGLKDRYVKLGFYLGDKTYLQDSSLVDAKGNVSFSGDEALHPGIYMLIINNGKIIEILVNRDNQHFSVTADTADTKGATRFKDSPDNDLFYEYLRFLDKKQAEAKPLNEAFTKAKAANNKADIDLYQGKLKAIDDEVKAYKNNVMATKPQTFLAAIFNASWEPEVPTETPKLPNGRPDSTFAYKYFKGHYFDKFDFSDERLIYTPILQSKVRTYLDKLTPQTPDSLCIATKYVSDKAQANKEVFKFVVNHITNYYETSKVMGFDAIFVCMAKEYYLTGKTYWVDSAQNVKIKERVIAMEPMLLGKPALDLVTLPDSTGKIIKLSDIKSEYVVVFFWDPNCGHCQKVTPKLYDLYKKVKSLGVEVYAVGSTDQIKDWKKYVKEKDLRWVNVLDEIGYRKFYDVTKTPELFLLDKNRKIVAKKLEPEQLEDFLKKQYKLNF